MLKLFKLRNHPTIDSTSGAVDGAPIESCEGLSRNEVCHVPRDCSLSEENDDRCVDE